MNTTRVATAPTPEISDIIHGSTSKKRMSRITCAKNGSGRVCPACTDVRICHSQMVRGQMPPDQKGTVAVAARPTRWVQRNRRQRHSRWNLKPKSARITPLTIQTAQARCSASRTSAQNRLVAKKSDVFISSHSSRKITVGTAFGNSIEHVSLRSKELYIAWESHKKATLANIRRNISLIDQVVALQGNSL